MSMRSLTFFFPSVTFVVVVATCPFGCSGLEVGNGASMDKVIQEGFVSIEALVTEGTGKVIVQGKQTSTTLLVTHQFAS